VNWIELDQRVDSWVNSQCSVPLVSSALSPETWPFSLEWLPQSACLVGGTVRDALLARERDYLDLDFVLPVGAVETAQAIARHYKAGYVLLDAERQIARVVFEQGTADFALQVGATLEVDLERRDFTVNAIAYNPHTDQIIDPLQGYADLQRKQLRMVSPHNLQEDPLRLLRAYRQAAQLGFTVEAMTQTVIRQLSGSLRQIAAERVQSELNYLLGSIKSTPWLTVAWQDGLLRDWFPDATAQSLETVAAIDQVAIILEESLPSFAHELSSRIRGLSKAMRAFSGSASATEVSPFPPNGATPSVPKVQGSYRTWLTIAKLASLLPMQPTAAEAQMRRLKYSRHEIQAVSTVLKFLPQLNPAFAQSEETAPLEDWAMSNAATHDSNSIETIAPLSFSPLRQQYEFFQGVGTAFPAVVVLAIATGVPLEAIIPLIQRFLMPDDPVAHPIPLLTGQDLMTQLHLPAGPRIGRLLAAIQLARAEGKIHSPEEALQFAVSLGEAP